MFLTYRQQARSPFSVPSTDEIDQPVGTQTVYITSETFSWVARIAIKVRDNRSRTLVNGLR
jgi:hypothetical protein